MRISREAPRPDVPELSFDPIERPRLCDRLDAAVHAREHILVSAAAGTGKTVAVAEWARRSRPGTAIGWLTVTESLDHAEQLWPALHACLGIPDTGAAAREYPFAPTDPAANLVAALDSSIESTVLVVDDAHVITDPIALAGLEYFLTHVPARVTVVVCARCDPPLRWHTLELSGRVTRLGADDLALTAAQVRELCEQHDCALDEAELAQVMDLTSGWAALVRIAALHLSTHGDDRRSALARFALPAPEVSTFLVEELLAALPATLRQFLLYTSVPAAFTPALAEELAGPSAAHLLPELERANVPIIHSARDGALWIGYHPLLRAHLHAEIRYAGRALTADLNRRTATWFDRADLPLAALPHLLADPGSERLVEFLRRRGMAIVLDGGGAVLFAQLDCARPILAEDPYIRLLRAVDALAHGDATSGVGYLDRVGENGGAAAESVAPAAWLSALDRAARVDTAVFTEAAAHGRISATIASVGQPDIDGYLATQSGTARLLHGDRAGAEDQLRRGLALATSANHPRLALRSVTRLAVAAGLDGAVGTMRERAAKALDVAADHGLRCSPDATQALALSAFGAYLHGDSWSAEESDALTATREHLDGSVEPVGGWSAQVIGRLLAFRTGPDRYAAADELRAGMLALLERGGPFPVGSARLLPHVVWALLGVREPRTAQLLIERARAVVGDAPEVALSQAASALVMNKPPALNTALAAAHERSAELATPERVTLWLLDAARSALDDASHKARCSVDEALARAAPDGLVRPFLDVPGAVALLDRQVGTCGPHDGLVDRIRRHRDARHDGSGQALTQAESTVLKHLPSGHTAQEIAADLGVSVNTVKTHLRGIYAKLGANSRKTALDQARRSGLL